MCFRNGSDLDGTGGVSHEALRGLRVPGLQNPDACRSFVHHGPLHQLRGRHRNPEQAPGAVLDQDGRGTDLRAQLLKLYFTHRYRLVGTTRAESQTNSLR